MSAHLRQNTPKMRQVSEPITVGGLCERLSITNDAIRKAYARRIGGAMPPELTPDEQREIAAHFATERAGRSPETVAAAKAILAASDEREANAATDSRADAESAPRREFEAVTRDFQARLQSLEAQVKRAEAVAKTAQYERDTAMQTLEKMQAAANAGFTENDAVNVVSVVAFSLSLFSLLALSPQGFAPEGAAIAVAVSLIFGVSLRRAVRNAKRYVTDDTKRHYYNTILVFEVAAFGAETLALYRLCAKGALWFLPDTVAAWLGFSVAVSFLIAFASLRALRGAILENE